MTEPSFVFFKLFNILTLAYRNDGEKVEGIMKLKKFNKTQLIVMISRLIHSSSSQLVFTGILVDLTCIGVITNTSQSVAYMLTSLAYVIIRPIYEKYKNIVRNHISLIWGIDMLCSIIGSAMIIFSTDSQYINIGWIILYIIVESSTSPLIEYSVTDILFEEILDSTSSIAEFDKISTQLSNAGSIVAYICSIFLAPIMPTFVKFIFMILGTCGTGIGYVFYVIPKLDEKKK